MRGKRGFGGKNALDDDDGGDAVAGAGVVEVTMEMLDD